MRDNAEVIISNLDDDTLWEVYAHAKVALRERKLVRTNNITGERGEYLAIATFNTTPGLPNLQAAPEGTQNVDALSRNGERYSIKTITEPNSLTGVFYGLGDQTDSATERKFEYVLIVVIDQMMHLKQLLQISWQQFLELRRWHKTMRAWNLSITRKLLAVARRIF